jgi:ubiquinone biosynthesis protein COQ4
MDSTSPHEPLPVADVELQRDAVRAVLSGSRLARLRVAARALGRLLRDPDDTTQVLAIGIALNGPHIDRIRALFASDPEGAELLRDRPRLDGAAVDREALRRLPDGTLGREYVRFLDDHGLNGDFFQPPPDVPDEIAFLSTRLRQAHDVWHPVTGYGPSVRDEIALQAFTWAQLGVPHAKVVVIGGLLRWAAFDRGLVRHAIRGYRRGRRARAFAPVRWERRWERPLAEVRAELGLEAELGSGPCADRE